MLQINKLKLKSKNTYPQLSEEEVDHQRINEKLRRKEKNK